MAKQVSVYQYTGKLGEAVGSKGLDGKIMVRRAPASVSNPQTDAQMAQRAKLKLAAKVAGMLAEVGKTALVANGFKATRRGQLNKQLLEKMYVEDLTAKLPRVLNLVNNGVQANVPNEVPVTCRLDGMTFTAGFGEALPAGTVTAKALLVYNKITGEWISTSSLDSARTLELFVPDAANCDAYFYAQMVVPTTAEAAARLNALTANTPGYNVSIARLDSSSYKYTKTFNAGMVDGTAYSEAVPANVAYAIAQNANTLYRAMKSAIDTGLASTAREMGVAIEQAFANVNDGNIVQKMVDTEWDKLIISQGELTGVALGEANFTVPLTVSVPIDDSYSDPRYNSDDDQVFIVVYSKTNDRAIISEGVKRTGESVSVTIPSYWQGHYVEVYAYVVGAAGTVSEGLVSDTIYCGQGRIA